MWRNYYRSRCVQYGTFFKRNSKLLSDIIFYTHKWCLQNAFRDKTENWGEPPGLFSPPETDTTAIYMQRTSLIPTLNKRWKMWRFTLEVPAGLHGRRQTSPPKHKGKQNRRTGWEMWFVLKVVCVDIWLRGPNGRASRGYLFSTQDKESWTESKERNADVLHNGNVGQWLAERLAPEGHRPEPHLRPDVGKPTKLRRFAHLTRGFLRFLWLQVRRFFYFLLSVRYKSRAVGTLKIRQDNRGRKCAQTVQG